MSGNDLHVVIGGSGGVGSAVVAELVRRGHQVRAVSRHGSPHRAGVQVVTADVSHFHGAVAACRGAAVVYHCAQPPYVAWTREFPGLTEAVTAGAAAAGAKLVMIDNLYMYGRVRGPISEQTPQRPTGDKGRLRAEMAERLLAAHRAGRVRVAIGRASDYYGPGGRNAVVGDRIFNALLTGYRVRWLGKLDVLHTLSYLPDIARALVTIGEREEADGQAWHLPAAPPITGRSFLELGFSELGTRPRIGRIPAPMVWLGGVFNANVREVRETLYQWQQPFLLDAQKYQRTFGPSPATPHPDGVAETLAWFRSEIQAPSGGST